MSKKLEGRSLERGKLIFEQATCSRCHSTGNHVLKNGPDLAGVTERFRNEKLLRQMVKPSAEINKDYQTQIIMVDDGRLLTGLVTEETPDYIKLMPNLLKPDQIETIETNSIEGRRIAEVSTMPVGLLDTYHEEEVLDLLAFIQSLKPKPTPGVNQ